MSTRFTEPDTLIAIEALRKLDPFSKTVLTYAKLLQLTGASSLKPTSAAAPLTSTDMVYQYLQKAGAHDWETGKTLDDIIRSTGLARTTVQKALKQLRERNIVKRMQQGVTVKFHL